ncbi:MAG: hypothetical protein ACTSRW_01350 [Candidatus Helarchaeota archaeon]
MSFFDKLKSDLFGDISAIETLKNKEADIFKAKKKLAREELEGIEALREWSEAEQSDSLKTAVEKYYDTKKDIIEAYQDMIDKCLGDYVGALERIAQKVELLTEATNAKIKTEKKIEKTRDKLDKKKFDLEKAQASGKGDKIRKKELEVEKIKTELTGLEKDLDGISKKVDELKEEVEEYKYKTLREALSERSKHEREYMDVAKKIFDAYDNLIESIPEK